MLLFRSRVRHRGRSQDSDRTSSPGLRQNQPSSAASGVRWRRPTRNRPLHVETDNFTLKPSAGGRHAASSSGSQSRRRTCRLQHFTSPSSSAPFLALPIAGWLGRRRVGSLLLAALPAALTGYFAYTFSVVSRRRAV